GKEGERKNSGPGNNIGAVFTRLHSKGTAVRNQPARRRAKVAAGTRLRRRLSKIFQRLNAESGLCAILPSPTGTRGLSQSMICQSPRIQRCWRFHHAM